MSEAMRIVGKGARLGAAAALALAALAAAPAQAQEGKTGWNKTDTAGNPVASAPNQASQDGFGVFQIATTDPQKLLDAWAQPTPGVEIGTQSSATRNQVIAVFLLFHGCKADADGRCILTARFDVFDPDGKPYAEQKEAPMFSAAPPPGAGAVQLSNASLGLRIEDGEKLGAYRVVAHTTDNVAKITLTTEQVLTIVEAPRTGGWQSIPDPASDADLRPIVAAALGKVPRKGAKLGAIDHAERQIVAGTNYRLLFALADGSRWTATVWRKLDGSLAVSGVAEVR